MHLPSNVFGAAIRVGSMLGALMIAFPFPSQSQTDGVDWRVPFLTLRDLAAADGPGAFFGDERSVLRAGWCRVRDVELGALAPLADSAPAFIREQFLRVEEVQVTEVDAVLDALRETPPAIFVHGYYIDFEKGCRRAALVQENAGLAGRFLWFSWPSDGDLANYMHDEADLYWSVPDLADAIIALDSRFGSGVVDVIGHSMGARGVALALYEVAFRRPDIRLGEIVLLAPDMDFAIFQRLLPRVTPIAKSITVYVADDDRPLALSAQLHGYPRLGETGNDIAALDGVEVIDLSDLETESPTGHLYHAYSAGVGEDLSQLLNDGLRAVARKNLVLSGPNTWNLMESGGSVSD
ncbi:MAG: alpha/beta fold hydrolase [Paracoccaceae bacterium]|nr:alpha/beta fold hydrolase [Paracoccaceae bacterium]